MSATRYPEIAERLSAELAQCAHGTRVAGEAEIARRFGVGRAAARAAVQELERRFVVRRTQGSGTFVNRRIDYVISRSVPPSWSATIAAACATPRALVKSVRTIPLPADLADRFERPAGSPVHEVVREFYIDDLLASWVHEWSRWPKCPLWTWPCTPSTPSTRCSARRCGCGRRGPGAGSASTEDRRAVADVAVTPQRVVTPR
ncbi:GntR family transcriptional regulator [Streptomyces sp. GMR22]|uniref:GntR family transcriptional regulator n=1 Tax=Streptomyces sp. GMR22 TaxID=2759524 RepID=UPI0018EF5166|nr:GntR family transcriptional regulator [Streptomyces sp. GMR22]